jgi:choline dehydrogenase-like flavoprotein
MSAHEDGGPADERGRVRGTTGLVVADASLLPAAPGVNPQVTIMALALHVARALLDA